MAGRKNKQKLNSVSGTSQISKPDQEAIKKLLHQAMAFFNTGKLNKARKAGEQIMALSPGHADALHILGLVAFRGGKPEKGVGFMEKAIAARPNFTQACFNLGNMLKDFERYDEAAGWFSKAIQLNPDFAMGHNNHGLALKELGQFDEAIESFRKAIVLKPDFAQAFNNLGNVLRFKNIPEEAAVNYRKAIKIQPEYAIAHNNLGAVLKDLWRLDEAIKCLDKAISLQSDYAEAHNNLGNTYSELGNLDEAVISYNKAIMLRPEYMEAMINLGQVLREHGKLEESIQVFYRALVIDPNHGEAHRQLSITVKHSEYDKSIEAMEEVFKNPELSDTNRLHLTFGLGKAYEDIKQFDQAFDMFLMGNSLERKINDYNPEKNSAYFSRLKQTFTVSFIEALDGGGCDDKTPIFIVGMPRSGTSLVEQILASHSEIYGAGELGFFYKLAMSSPYSDPDAETIMTVDDANIEDFKILGEKYSSILRGFDSESRFITDKLPHNFLHIGIIRLALPKAKIIHCKRNPEDNCLSLFVNYFSANGIEFSYDLEELGKYHVLYQCLMDHWHSIMPGHIYDINYEDMINDQESATRGLLDYCDLEWEDACLDFHQTKRPVKTASVVQVRQPIYKSSVQKWKRYEKQLAPLLEILRPSE